MHFEEGAVRRKTQGGQVPLEAAVRRVTPSSVRSSLAKTARIVFQLTPDEKEQIVETARGFGMTISEYMLSIHRLFRKLSGGKTPKSIVKGRTDLN